MNEYQMREALETDIDFIFNSILDLSKKHHAHPSYYWESQNESSSPIINGLKHEIRCAVLNKQHPKQQIESVIYIYSVNSQPCSMCWIKGDEIYLFYTMVQSRCQGIGTKFLKRIVSMLLVKRNEIFARVYIDKSLIFEQMLLKQGFSEDRNHNANDTKKYIIKRQQ